MIVLALAFGGCAKYNYLYNADKNFAKAEKQRRDAPRDQRAKKANVTAYDKSVESCGRLLLFFPGSRWEPDALLLLTKAYYRNGKYRSCTGKVDELKAKYPDSPLLEEATLWKGLSLLKLAQPDSARSILSDVVTTTSNRELVGEAWFGLGDYLYGQRYWQQAYEMYQKASESGTTDLWLRNESWAQMGDCLTQLKQYNESVRLYNSILAAEVTRRLRFEATLQKSTALRLSGHSEDALQLVGSLLDEGAFVDDFPRVHLEAARCERALGRYQEARDRLQDAGDDEKRGETGAQIQFELGALIWDQWHDYLAATTALKAVKTTERTATVAPEADSLLAEVEALSGLWGQLSSLDRQLSLIDSSKSGLRPLMPSDTNWVDTTFGGGRAKAATPPRKPPKGNNAPVSKALQKMVEDAMKADSASAVKAQQDSLAILDSLESVAKAVVLPLDSSSTISVAERRSASRDTVRFELAEYHLFERNALDSARIYLEAVVGSGVRGELEARTLAGLAYICRLSSDSTASDSIYRLILAKATAPEWKHRAEEQLRIAHIPPPRTQTQMLIDSAEVEWKDKNDPNAARMLYLLAAETADTSDTLAANALLASAYLSKSVIGEDSLAKNLYAQVKTRFPKSAAAKIAATRIAPKQAEKLPNRQVPKPAGDDEEDRSIAEQRLAGRLATGSDSVYSPDRVDELPALTTPKSLVETYESNFYPPGALLQRLTGTAEVEMVITADGKPTELKVSSVNPKEKGFEDAAISVINLLQYRAGRYHGVPVNVRFKQSLTFKPPMDN